MLNFENRTPHSVEIRSYLKRIPGLRATVRYMRGRPRHVPRTKLLKKMPRRSVCAEIGIHGGDYTHQILRHVEPVKLHLIDPWKHESGEQYKEALYGTSISDGQATMDKRFNAVKARFAEQIERHQVQVHRAYSSDVVYTFSDNYFDWMYIDGNHLHEFVKKDLQLYYPKVKPGGYLTGDDYGVEGWWKNGVKTAVDDFVTQYGLA